MSDFSYQLSEERFLKGRTNLDSNDRLAVGWASLAT